MADRGKVIVVEDADKQISKEVVLDITEKQFIELKKTLQSWLAWRRKEKKQEDTKTTPIVRKSKKKAGGKTYQDFQTIGPILKKEGENFILIVNRWVGTISISDLIIELRPKFSVRASNNIICANALKKSNVNFFKSPNFTKEGASAVGQPLFSSIEEDEMGLVVSYLFVSFLEEIFKKGVRSDYHLKEVFCLNTKGKILISKQMKKQQGILFPVHCLVQRFSYDIPENQIIKAALKRIIYLLNSNQQLSYGNSEKIALLIEKLTSFYGKFNQMNISTLANVSYASLPKIRYTKLNSYYQPACSIAKMILHSSKSNLENNSKTGERMISSCWLHNMANEFEQFVRDSLQEGERLTELEKGRVEWTMSDSDEVRMEPDLVLDNSLLVGDVKYRVYSPAKRRSDLFQILAYSSTKIAVMQDTVLIYATADQVVKESKMDVFSSCSEFTDHLFSRDLRENKTVCCTGCSFICDLLCSWNLDKRIWCCCLDLPNSTFKQLKEQLKHVIDIIEKHLP